MKRVKLHNRGFTIIELMIATAVFAVILLLITTAMLQIGRAYYRGLNESKVLDVTRSAIDEVAQTIQFSGANIAGTDPGSPLVNGATRGYCIGTIIYSYLPGSKGVNDATHIHGLVSHTVASGCGSPGAVPQNLASPTLVAGSKEFLGDNMRVSKFSVVQDNDNPSLYTITLRVISGDDDLICSPKTTPNSCNGGGSLLPAEKTADDLTCRNLRAGTQFCAVSELTTTVQRRIGGQ